MSLDFAAVLTKMVEVRASDVHLTPGFPPAMRVRGAIVPMDDYPAAEPAGHPRDRLLDPQRLPAQAVRERAAARLRLLDPRRGPVPRQLLLPARRDLRRLPPHPARDPEPRVARAAAGAGGVHPQAARLRARHRPDRLRQVDHARLDGRHDQRASARSTSSRSRTRSSSSTGTRSASSTSARSAPTRSTSPAR